MKKINKGRAMKQTKKEKDDKIRNCEKLFGCSLDFKVKHVRKFDLKFVKYQYLQRTASRHVVTFVWFLLVFSCMPKGSAEDE